MLCELVADMQLNMKPPSPSDTSFYVPGNGDTWERRFSDRGSSETLT